MTDEPDNLVLIYLRRLDAKIGHLSETMSDFGRGLTTLEITVGNLAATEMSHYANLSLRMDRVEHRLDRIENRLTLRDA